MADGVPLPHWRRRRLSVDKCLRQLLWRSGRGNMLATWVPGRNTICCGPHVLVCSPAVVWLTRRGSVASSTVVRFLKTVGP